MPVYTSTLEIFWSFTQIYYSVLQHSAWSFPHNVRKWSAFWIKVFKYLILMDIDNQFDELLRSGVLVYASRLHN
jgi:hypothetical protein